MLEQFAREFMQLYPNARLLVAAKEDLTQGAPQAADRQDRQRRVGRHHHDPSAASSGSACRRDYQEQFLREQIEEYDQLLCDSAGTTRRAPAATSSRPSRSRKPRREERLKDLLAEDKKDDGLVFDELGVDHIFIDEAHYFKNLETPTKMERVAGIQTGGSERAFDLYMKARYLDEQHPGHGVTFATGTPISNTMVEMYTMQRFLDPEGLKSRGIEHFDAWAATFGEVVDTMEISPDGATLTPRSRFARFVNLPELQQMFRAFADVQTAEMLDLPRPRLEGGKPIVVACPMSEEQATLQQELVARYDRLRIAEGRSRGRTMPWPSPPTAASSPSTPGCCPATAADFPGSKINALVDNVAAIWQRTAADARHADDLLRHGRESDALGVLASMTRSSTSSSRAASPASRSPPSATPTPTPRNSRCSSKVRSGSRPRADRQHAEDGHRHQRPETPGRPAPSRRPVEAGRGRAARRPHPPPGQ